VYLVAKFHENPPRIFSFYPVHKNTYSYNWRSNGTCEYRHVDIVVFKYCSPSELEMNQQKNDERII